MAKKTDNESDLPNQPTSQKGGEDFAKEDKKNKKNTSLRLDKKTLKALKILAIEQETSVQKLIESLIHDYIEKHTK